MLVKYCYSFLLVLILNILFSSKTQAFSYQFVLADNQIQFEYERLTSIFEQIHFSPQVYKALVFDYQLSSQETVPTDLPLFIVAFDREIIFYANSEALNRGFLQAEIDLQSLSATYPEQWPVFYQNKHLKTLDLEIKNLHFAKQLKTVDKSSARLDDLSIFKEGDHSVTIIFTVHETQRNLHQYKLVCLDQKEQVLAQIPLQQADHYLWAPYSFVKLLPNHQQELIFHVEDLPCAGQLYVLRDDGLQSAPTAIVPVQNL